MFNLWNYLILPRRMRRFVLLDASGRCLALRECSRQPSQDGWVEVQVLCPSWLGQCLPDDARVGTKATPAWAA
ncbi:hypothetical protein [Pseudomonas sp. LRF_L74]|uniref:hypothetical protein n=1 Tax=Pseudomonas sp. LRF_L74 TaxID=3369422 RepID=UPI003F629508